MDFIRENKNTFIYHGLPAIVVLVIIFLQFDYGSFELFFNSVFYVVLINPLLLIAFILYGKKFLNVLWAFLKQLVQILSLTVNERLVAHVGPPGSGKTVMAGYKVNILAKQRYRELEYRYFLSSALYDMYLEKTDLQRLQEFNELESTYLYYQRNPDALPGVISNLPLRKGDKYCTKLEIDHVKQKKKLPAYSCWLEDEVDLEQGSNTSRSIEPIIQATYKLPRHLGEWVIYLTAQNPAKLGDFIRGNLDHMDACEKQTWYLKPSLLVFIHDLMRSRFIRKYRRGKLKGKKAARKARRLQRLNKFVRSVGYRQIKYKRMSNSELNTEKDSKRGRKSTYYIPSTPCFDYSDRAWRDTYQCGDDYLFCETFKRMYLDKDDLKFEIIKEQKREREKRQKAA